MPAMNFIHIDVSSITVIQVHQEFHAFYIPAFLRKEEIHGALSKVLLRSGTNAGMNIQRAHEEHEKTGDRLPNL
jgi:hypothetical protein